MKTFKCNNRTFSVQIDGRTNTPYVSSINPYDMTEYHWARQVQNSYRWEFFRQGRRVETVVPRCNVHEDELFMQVAEKLCDLDSLANLRPHIDRT